MIYTAYMSSSQDRRGLASVPTALVFALRHPIFFRLVGGALVGGVLGIAAFSMTGLKGLALATVTGCVCGGLGSVLWWAYSKRLPELTLHEITLGVNEFTQFKFVVDAEHRRAAWKLFIELITRVATQPLAVGDGDLGLALKSLHGIFGTVREQLKTMNPSKNLEGDTVEMLAVRMLNLHLRPFLTKWHPHFDTHAALPAEESQRAWVREEEFRADLEALRLNMHQYVRAFGELAGVKGVDRFFNYAKTS